VGDVELVISYTGKTLLAELPMYEGATHSSGRRCALRVITKSRPDGSFVLSAKTMLAHVGEPEFHVVAYRDQYRSKVVGDSVQTKADDVTIDVWSEETATKYAALDGRVIDFSRISNPATYTADHLSEHGFLTNWLAFSGLTRRCERDLTPQWRARLLVDLLKKWVDSSPAHPKPGLERATCGEVVLMRKQDIPGIEEQIDTSAFRRLCSDQSQ
jgi:hypothetical protein